MTRRLLISIAALAALTLAARPAAAQGPAPRRPVWLTVGLVGTADEMIGAGAGVTYALTRRQLITVRALALEETEGCINCAPGSLDRTLAAGVLYGVAAHSRAGLASLAAGIGGARVRRMVATGAETAPFVRRTERTVASIPVEAQLFWRPLRFVGYGVAAVADLNPERSLAGLLLGVQLGRLSPEWGLRRAATSLAPPAPAPGGASRR